MKETDAPFGATYQAIGAEVTRRRKAAGIAKAALAREARITWNAMHLIEQGRTIPHPTTLTKIERALERLIRDAAKEDS